jgi:2-polyprenyl-3-methyl-5-hydroxy-6-metoxy-1,4-benzoquinol methylase
MTESVPSDVEQQQFWDKWNTGCRTADHGICDFMQRQIDVALHWIEKCPIKPLRILEVGCGTGWLAGQLQDFGRVSGVDLSPLSIADAKVRFPQVEFAAGDFATMSFEPGFGFVVSADVIAHVPDQAAFVDKLATLMAPGGLMVLMTQNPFVWNRSSYLKPKGEGQIRDWPSRKRIRELVRGKFRVVHESSIVPGGDRGILKIANSYKVTKMLRAVLGERRQTDLYERAFVGRELVVVAQRM